MWSVCWLTLPATTEKSNEQLFHWLKHFPSQAAPHQSRFHRQSAPSQESIFSIKVWSLVSRCPARQAPPAEQPWNPVGRAASSTTILWFKTFPVLDLHGYQPAFLGNNNFSYVLWTEKFTLRSFQLCLKPGMFKCCWSGWSLILLVPELRWSRAKQVGAFQKWALEVLSARRQHPHDLMERTVRLLNHLAARKNYFGCWRGQWRLDAPERLPLRSQPAPSQFLHKSRWSQALSQHNW